MICDGAARSAKHRADPESPPPPRVPRGLKLRTGLRLNLVGHREVPADVFFDEPQSRAKVHIGFTPPRLWITSGLPYSGVGVVNHHMRVYQESSRRWSLADNESISLFSSIGNAWQAAHSSNRHMISMSLHPNRMREP